MLVAARLAGSPWAESRALVSFAMVAHKQGHFETGQQALEHALTVARNAGDAWSVAMTLVPLGDLERSRGKHARARELYRECLALFADIGLTDHPLQQPYLLHNLGYVALAEGDVPHGRQLFLDAVGGYRRAGDHRGLAECLIGLGATAAADSRPQQAVQLFAAGEAALASLGTVLWHANVPDYERWRGVASAALEPAAFESAWSAGAALSVEDALALAKTSWEAQSVATERSKDVLPEHPGGTQAALTRREFEVARLVAAGLTNRQIGQALVITDKTAANHVQRVLEKLDLHSRAQLAARAGELGIQHSDGGSTSVL